jgi:hypothetical protein
VEEKIKVAGEKLEKMGHSVERIILGETPRYQIDGGNALTVQQMHDVAEDVYSCEELIDLLRRQP